MLRARRNANLVSCKRQSSSNNVHTFDVKVLSAFSFSRANLHSKFLIAQRTPPGKYSELHRRSYLLADCREVFEKRNKSARLRQITVIACAATEVKDKTSENISFLSCGIGCLSVTA